jgi:hypothetical protein
MSMSRSLHGPCAYFTSKTAGRGSSAVSASAPAAAERVRLAPGDQMTAKASAINAELTAWRELR